jgi:hypothetical protein
MSRHTVEDRMNELLRFSVNTLGESGYRYRAWKRTPDFVASRSMVAGTAIASGLVLENAPDDLGDRFGDRRLADGVLENLNVVPPASRCFGGVE